MRIVTEATKHVHSEFIHVENKGYQMKGKRNHSQMTVREKGKRIQKREKANRWKKDCFPIWFWKCLEHKIQFYINVGNNCNRMSSKRNFLTFLTLWLYSIQYTEYVYVYRRKYLLLFFYIQIFSIFPWKSCWRVNMCNTSFLSKFSFLFNSPSVILFFETIFTELK